jgi:hypothetical protein
VVCHQINSHLTYILKTSKNLSSALFFVRKSKNYLSYKALKYLYYPLFHSVLIYGIQIWPSASPSNFACLKLKQKAAVRIVLGTEHLNILPLHLMQHFIQDFLPDSFNNLWSLNAYRRNAESHIALRNDVFDVPFARISLTERQPLTRIVS